MAKYGILGIIVAYLARRALKSLSMGRSTCKGDNVPTSKEVKYLSTNVLSGCIATNASVASYGTRCPILSHSTLYIMVMHSYLSLSCHDNPTPAWVSFRPVCYIIHLSLDG
jgi:hypothetical protein